MHHWHCFKDEINTYFGISILAFAHKSIHVLPGLASIHEEEKILFYNREDGAGMGEKKYIMRAEYSLMTSDFIGKRNTKKIALHIMITMCFGLSQMYV